MSLLFSQQQTKRERREAALQAMAFLTSSTQNPNGIPEASLYSQLTTANTTFPTEIISIKARLYHNVYFKQSF